MQSQEEVIQLVQLIFTTQDFNRLMQLRPFYFDMQINVSPWFAAQKTSAIVCTISFERPVNYLCDAWHVFPPKYEAWTHFNN